RRSHAERSHHGALRDAAGGPRLIGNGFRAVDARGRDPAAKEAITALQALARPRHLSFERAASGFSLGAEPLALRPFGLAIGPALGLAARALLFLLPARELPRRLAFGELAGAFLGGFSALPFALLFARFLSRDARLLPLQPALLELLFLLLSELLAFALAFLLEALLLLLLLELLAFALLLEALLFLLLSELLAFALAFLLEALLLLLLLELLALALLLEALLFLLLLELLAFAFALLLEALLLLLRLELLAFAFALLLGALLLALRLGLLALRRGRLQAALLFAGRH